MNMMGSLPTADHTPSTSTSVSAQFVSEIIGPECSSVKLNGVTDVNFLGVSNSKKEN